MPEEVNYTPRQLQTMQQEAIRRVQEMQRRSRRSIGQGQGSPSHSAPAQQPAPQPPPAQQNAPPPQPAPQQASPPPPSFQSQQPFFPNSSHPFSLDQVIQMKNPLTTLMEAFHIDHDRLMILFVMMMVLGDGADLTLLLALVYLLL